MSFNDRKICHSGEGYVLAICLKMKQGQVFLLILVQCYNGFSMYRNCHGNLHIDRNNLRIF